MVTLAWAACCAELKLFDREEANTAACVGRFTLIRVVRSNELEMTWVVVPRLVNRK